MDGTGDGACLGMDGTGDDTCADSSCGVLLGVKGKLGVPGMLCLPPPPGGCCCGDCKFGFCGVLGAPCPPCPAGIGPRIGGRHDHLRRLWLTKNVRPLRLSTSSNHPSTRFGFAGP
eukprot:3587675-Rhodomonas_salina.3